MKKISISFLGAALAIVVGLAFYFQPAVAHEHKAAAPGGEAVAELNGPLSNATVSFGGWMTTPRLDRFPDENPILANHHKLTPKTVKIKAGGTVNFIIGGFHNIQVYDNGTEPGDIDPSITVPPTNGGPPIINDPRNRVYRGLDPSLFPQDRVEVVHFDEPGIYLVICGVVPHFNDGMFGYVRVLPGNDTEQVSPE